MYSALVLIPFLVLSLPAHADNWAAKAFHGQKVRLQKAHRAAVTTNENLMLIVDQDCLRRESYGVKHGDLLKAAGFSAQHKISGLKVQAISAKLDTPMTSTELEDHLSRQNCILGVSENPSVSVATSPTPPFVDPLLNDQTYLAPIGFNSAQKFFFHPIFGIRQDVTIGIIDTGMQLNHPDLFTRLWHGPGGEVGYDFFNNDADPSDDFGHGTHVAGILGAQGGNGVGIRGVMGQYSRLMPVKAQDSFGNGTLADILNGFNWAVEHGAEVVNMSLAAFGTNPPLAAAMADAVDNGVVIVAAAGNQNKEIMVSDFVIPAGHAPEHGGLISVGSIDAATGLRSSFSNYGPNYVEIAAPGEATGVGLLSTILDGDYGLKIGTSMSTPQVAAAAGLVIGYLKTRGITVSPAQVENYILDSASVKAANQTYFGAGRSLNLENLGRYLFNSTVVDSTGGFDE